jgi:hypothetical protein
MTEPAKPDPRILPFEKKPERCDPPKIGLTITVDVKVTRPDGAPR